MKHNSWLVVLVAFAVSFFVGAMGQAKRPGVAVTLNGVCQHESHEHADDDLRVRRAVIIRSVDACGFTYETKTDTGRLEVSDETVIGEGPSEGFGHIGQVKLLTRGSIRPNRVAMVFFCQYCKQAITVRLTSEGT